LAGKDERHGLFSYLEERFGIEESLFDDCLLFRRRKSWSLLRNAPHVSAVAHLKVSKIGIKAFQKVGAFVKPTTRMIQAFGHMATRAKVTMTKTQLDSLVAGDGLPMELPLEKGYVILSLGEDFILGLGFYAQGKVRSQLPKKELRKPVLQVP